MRNIESREARTETTPETVAEDAVASLEAKDANYQKWIAGKGWSMGKGLLALGGVAVYGAIQLALKTIEVSASVLEHVAKNATNIDDLKFYSGLWDAAKKPFKSEKKEK